MKFDSETVEMVMQDFLKRQKKLFMNEVYENFMASSTHCYQEPPFVKLTRDSFNDYINRVYEESHYKRYIRLPEPLKNFIKCRSVVGEVVSEEISDIKRDTHKYFMSLIGGDRK